MTLYWHKHPDGSMTRKLVEDWTDEERALHARHKVFLKEADALGYVFRLDADSQKLVGSLKSGWVGLTDEERNDCLVEADPCECLATPEAQELMRTVEAKLKEKNT
jgi:hypothetical protein